MGAIFNLNIIYTDLIPLLEKAKNDHIPIYGTLLRGENIYSSELTQKAIVIMGNESKGIRENLLPFIRPPFPVYLSSFSI